MQITHLSLTSFRNYGRLEIDFPAGATLLYGDNAQGKTNLLEAIFYMATTRSPQAETDHHLINWEATQTEEPVIVARLVAHVMTNEGRREIEMRLIQEAKGGRGNGRYSFRREALVNRRKVRLMDLLGNLRVVLFLPQDIQLITGSPSQRRRYLDITLCQIDPIYCRALSQYNKILEQRNALLRQLAEGVGNRDTLPIYTERLVQTGAQVFARRARFIENMGREAKRIHYESLTDGDESIHIGYLPQLDSTLSRRSGDIDELAEIGAWLQVDDVDEAQIAAQFAQALADAHTTEITRGTTTVGPHRDDWRFWVNNRSLNSYGSRGQQRSAILALKMAEINWMTATTEEQPILLLDEVVAELDEHRRASLLQAVQESQQAILTATDPGMFTETFLRTANKVRVENGRISAANPEL